MCVKYNNKRVLDYLREFDTQLYEEIKEKFMFLHPCKNKT